MSLSRKNPDKDFMTKHPFRIALPCNIALGALLFALQAASAQDAVPVPVGKGSYASTIPAGAGKGKPAQMDNNPINVLQPDDRPIPTNKYWTQMVFKGGKVGLWTYPLMTETSPNGLNIYFPTRFNTVNAQGKGTPGEGPVVEFPLSVSGKSWQAGTAQIKDWSDWELCFRQGTPSQYVDVTVGEGMPYTWLEYHGVQPVLTPTDKGLDKGKPVPATFFDRSGNTVLAPPAGDCFGIAFNGRQYGVFAPDNTTFTVDGGSVDVQFSGSAQFLVICPLPSPKDIAYFHDYAFAIPRDTKMTWHYDPVKGELATDWKITTQPLKGTNQQIIQGWIPHHYHGTVGEPLKFNTLEYITPRGKLRCTAGNEFTITYPFNGIVPNLPAPKDTTGEDPFTQARLHAYFDDLLKKPSFGADTYWGGKDILRYGQCALMAQQTNDPDYKAFVTNLQTAMANWYTYTPGKADHYFTRYPKLKALIGINSSYGSEAFNDNHFHYGYFTFATALLCAQDPQFAADYGGMATLVAKEYANWDRNDKNFPYFRTFDIWQGHSWAGGTGSGDGNNQESSSESVQSWAGLMYLGKALGNKEMTDAGVMGYTLETNSVMEYWWNYSGDVFDPTFPHPLNSMCWSSHNAYANYFSGDHVWNYAIQWLPASPMLSYLVRDVAFAKKSYDNMVKDAQAQGKPGTLESFGKNPGGVILGYLLMFDPDTVVKYFDTAPAAITGDAGEMTVMYYLAHSMETLGLVDWKCHGTSPTSMVYYNDKTKVRTFIVWNPLPQAEPVTFYEGNTPVAQMNAAPQALSSITK
jgi:endoglucanase Acf2